MANHNRIYGLYDEPFSTIIAVLFSIVVGANTLMFILSIVSVTFIGTQELERNYQYGGQGAGVFVNILFLNLIPVVICAISYLDLHLLRKQLLQPQRLVLSAATCALLWSLALLLWLPCTFQSSWQSYEYYGGSVSWDYCPYNSTSILDTNNIVPFLVAFPLICYALYLSVGIVAWRHSRKIPQQSLEAGQPTQLELNCRYKLASGVYTDINDGASDSLPSTFCPGEITSPAPTAQPPSYVTRDPVGGPPSRRPSFISEMSHWRRDVEMMSISGTSHLCTCCCHHGVAPAPQERIAEKSAGGSDQPSGDEVPGGWL